MKRLHCQAACSLAMLALWLICSLLLQPYVAYRLEISRSPGLLALRREKGHRGVHKRSSTTLHSKIPSIISSIQSTFLSNLFRKKDSTQSSPSSVIPKTDVVIIGGGIAGLSCAKTLINANDGLQCTILESSGRFGGRVGSETVHGYILDVGFQVFIDSYPESQQMFDYKGLQLIPFLPGAVVRVGDQFGLVSDPFRRPQDIFASVISPVGTLIDKIKVGLYSISAKFGDVNTIITRPDQDTYSFLREDLALTDGMINNFFRPFYQGIFLAPIEEQSSRMFEFLFKMFTDGSATLPKYGMQAIPDQLVQSLPSESLKTNCKVDSIIQSADGSFLINFINTDSGGNGSGKSSRNNEQIQASNVVIACDPVNAKLLLQQSTFLSSPAAQENLLSIDAPVGRSITSLYFAIDGPPPITDPILVLNGENKITLENNDIYPVSINNVCFPSSVSTAYAPPGKSLASITVVGDFAKDVLTDDDLQQTVKEQLVEWWGETVNTWKFIKIYRIPYAQPAQNSPFEPNFDNEKGQLELSRGYFMIGDHRSSPSLNGAVGSGRLAAEKILSRRSMAVKKSVDLPANVP